MSAADVKARDDARTEIQDAILSAWLKHNLGPSFPIMLSGLAADVALAAIAAEREAAAKVCDKAAAESVQDERDADAKDDNELSALACEARRTAVYLAAAIRARGAS